MGDTFEVMRSIEERRRATAVVIGAGYIGLEMAEALTTRGNAVTQIETLPQALPTVDPVLGALVHAELRAHGVEVITGTTVESVTTDSPGGPLLARAIGPDREPIGRTMDLVLVVVGSAPERVVSSSALDVAVLEPAANVRPSLRLLAPGGACERSHRVHNPQLRSSGRSGRRRAAATITTGAGARKHRTTVGNSKSLCPTGTGPTGTPPALR
ncbi:FAD-dependent oxidoreductase [Streptomyces sp. ISL-99]|uniref:NAD(P)/FAD-dependent oxidoreductase n=1 Tax=Streptomyces sp. ISL-99 TaxID=2819193 RepID=UPI001BE8B120|nr:FAD-dependent oxidoreductase [Streptomyces sp. ISL-99]MBT2527676.1 FAD-dependent oxidoreductase [Streptomyces sp. ISL-99]